MSPTNVSGCAQLLSRKSFPALNPMKPLLMLCFGESPFDAPERRHYLRFHLLCASLLVVEKIAS
jgi:hypothetical protein